MRRRPSAACSRRAPALLLVGLLLVAGGIADRAARPTAGEPGPVRPASFAVPSPGVLSAAWYCAAGTAAPGGMADASLVLANAGSAPVRGTATFVPADPTKAAVTVPVTVGPRARVVIPYRDHVSAQFAAALVELDGGGVAVEHSVSGPLGADVAPCASRAGTEAYFADGGTTRDAVSLIALYNPFPDDAVVDFTFATDQGRLAPQALQAVVVPAGRPAVVNVGENVLRRRAVSTAIRARSGRFVAERLQTYDGSDRRRGLALVPAAQAPATVWHFPEGYVQPGVIERFQVYNPGRRDAQVAFEFAMEQGAVEPVLRTVPAGDRITLRVDADTPVPVGVPHATTVRVDNGVGVVVERSVDAGPPAGRSGLASTLGATSAWRRWVLPAGLATREVDEWVVLYNPGRRAASVSFTVLASGQPLAVAGLQGVRLPAGRRTGIRLGSFVERADLGLVVTATEPVVVERDLYRVGRIGMSQVIGIPDPD
jgi:hypothetical protein